MAIPPIMKTSGRPRPSPTPSPTVRARLLSPLSLLLVVDDASVDPFGAAVEAAPEPLLTRTPF